MILKKFAHTQSQKLQLVNTIKTHQREHKTLQFEDDSCHKQSRKEKIGGENKKGSIGSDNLKKYQRLFQQIRKFL